ncbi:hypothetical protein N2152v2_000788 [Parachlorella kessleri]
MDRAFLAAVGIPLAVLVAAVAYLTRPPPQDRLDSGELFEDSITGTVFEAPEGTQPERDRLGELAFRAISYTPWPLEQGAAGDRLRIHVGPPGKTQPRTYVFSKVLPQPSQLVTVQLPRPLGIVFEEDARRKRAVVAGFVPGGNAEQLVRRFRFDPGLAARAPREGDVLRACTCTNIVYKSGALFFGAQRPERCIVVYGADGQKWPAVMAALQKGLVSDGEVTLVLERPVEAQQLGQLQRPGMQQEQQQQRGQQGRKV